MKKYFSNKIKNRKALLIDIYGTGTHLSKLKELTNLNCAIMMFVWSGFGGASKLYNYEKLSQNWIRISDALEMKLSDDTNFFAIDMHNDNFGMHDGLEWFNRATHNSPIRIKTIEVADKIIPEVIFDEICDTENLVVFQKFMKEILNSNIQWLKVSDVKIMMEILKFLLMNFAVEGNRIILR